MPLGERVTYVRAKLGMKQKDLAEASQITQATISRIESGQVKQLKSDALTRLATALGVTVDYLVGQTESVDPEEVVRLDDMARYIFRGYEKLSAEGREQLRNFLQFLEQQEEDRRGNG